jgi:hypothetical protein
MTVTRKGSCLCGSVRFELSAEPLFQGFCQCLDCRKVGAGHYAAIGMVSAAVKVSGECRRYGKPGDSGKMIYRNFCATCGSMVFDVGDGMPGVTIVNAALLDDPETFKPQSVVYARSALPWDHIDPRLPRFEALPPTA